MHTKNTKLAGERTQFGMTQETLNNLYPENGQPGIFRLRPLPWRYSAETRNVLAADGTIVCRNGDSVAGLPEIGETIVRVMNAIQFMTTAERRQP